MSGLPIDTPERMVAMFNSQLPSASPEMMIVLYGLISKWGGWHGATFRYLHTHQNESHRVANWSELRRMCVLI